MDRVRHCITGTASHAPDHTHVARHVSVPSKGAPTSFGESAYKRWPQIAALSICTQILWFNIVTLLCALFSGLLTF